MNARSSGSSNRKRRLLDYFERMLLIRETESRLSALFADGEIPGFIHLSIGQEAIPVGVTGALAAIDTVASTHRGHGHAIAKGVDLDGFFLEVMGKEEGICKGRGGSMHVAEMSVGMLGANGIVGAGMPLAVGSALAHQVRQTGGVAVAYFGDGALAEGVFHESLNLASLWKLPLLFVCENNGWSEFSRADEQFAAEIGALARAFKVPARKVDGNDVLAVADAAEALVAAIREGKGPALLECVTSRVHGHFEGDPQKYRAAEDSERAAANDPIQACEAQLKKAKVPASDVRRIRDDVAARVSAAVERARAGTPPAFERTRSDVYTGLTGARGD
jgi:pyruvate dehydrogenase E1 component alpha subunit